LARPLTTVSRGLGRWRVVGKARYFFGLSL
jgi:hypothetical protein